MIYIYILYALYFFLKYLCQRYNIYLCVFLLFLSEDTKVPGCYYREKKDFCVFTSFYFFPPVVFSLFSP